MPVHPYVPNSVPEIRKDMLRRIGARSVEELYSDIPQKIRLGTPLELPRGRSEYEVKKHVEAILSRNKSSGESLVFSGAGCWPHYVPAVCDEINSRSEFLTAYTGSVYSDLGRYQALFEYQSMLGELVAMDVVSFPLYDWATACGDALRMAMVITGRREILVPRILDPQRLLVMKAYCGHLGDIDLVEYNHETGELKIEDLKRKISSRTAAVYIENPTYLGFIETQSEEIGEIAHNHGALFVVGVEPLSLGVISPPGEYGADIVCGEGQPLGMHMYFGGALLGFLAFLDDERFVSATAHRLITITTNERQDQFGFAYVSPRRDMLTAQERAARGGVTGTTTTLWAITAAVYMSLLGPQGVREISQAIMQKSHYAIKKISEIDGITAPLFKSPHFEEFTVNFDGPSRTVSQVNKRLLSYGIHGGKDITREFPELGNTALYCVTEIHTKDDIDRLAALLEDSLDD